LSRAVASSIRASSSLDDVTLETRGRARGKYMTRARATRDRDDDDDDDDDDDARRTMACDLDISTSRDS
tara:strand:- start:4593 stop:4799 length:207 start_codon:yes stop_codon:yes gene_type:complete